MFYTPNKWREALVTLTNKPEKVKLRWKKEKEQF